MTFAHYVLGLAGLASSRIVSHAKFLFPLLLITFACNKRYEYIAPGEIETIQVRLQNSFDDHKGISCIYSVPQRYTSENEWPLIMALHGDGSSAAAFHDLWRPVADS